ncbi:ATP phosphoribosyltransferase regulatory subunit [Thermoproteota archaeon]
MKTQTPKGFNDLIPEEAELSYASLSKIEKNFKSLNYKKIRTPTLEYFDTLAKGIGSHLLSNTIRFVDQSGQLMMLRPDHTTPIARLVASRMRDVPLPIRLYYLNSVFRRQLNDKEHDVEFFQAGVELIGMEGPQADAEIIMVCIDSLKALGLKEIGVDIGHVSFIQGLSKDKKTALLEKDYITFGSIPECGGPEIIADNPYLLEVYNVLKKKKYDQYIHFNKGLVRQIQYYTGMIFDCYIKGARQIVGSGGRYDSLIGKFGYHCPAVGFALDATLIQSCLKK